MAVKLISDDLGERIQVTIALDREVVKHAQDWRQVLDLQFAGLKAAIVAKIEAEWLDGAS